MFCILTLSCQVKKKMTGVKERDRLFVQGGRPAVSVLPPHYPHTYDPQPLTTRATTRQHRILTLFCTPTSWHANSVAHILLILYY